MPKNGRLGQATAYIAKIWGPEPDGPIQVYAYDYSICVSLSALASVTWSVSQHTHVLTATDVAYLHSCTELALIAAENLTFLLTIRYDNISWTYSLWRVDWAAFNMPTEFSTSRCRELRSADSDHLIVPRTWHVSAGDRSFPVSVATIFRVCQRRPCRIIHKSYIENVVTNWLICF